MSKVIIGDTPIRVRIAIQPETEGTAWALEDGGYHVEWDDLLDGVDHLTWYIDGGYFSLEEILAVEDYPECDCAADAAAAEEVEPELSQEEVDSVILNFILGELGIALGFLTDGEDGFEASPQEIVEEALEVIWRYQNLVA